MFDYADIRATTFRFIIYDLLWIEILHCVQNGNYFKQIPPLGYASVGMTRGIRKQHGLKAILPLLGLQDLVGMTFERKKKGP